MKLNLIKNNDVILHINNVVSIDFDEEGFRIEYVNESPLTSHSNVCNYTSRYFKVDFDLLILRR